MLPKREHTAPGTGVTYFLSKRGRQIRNNKKVVTKKNYIEIMKVLGSYHLLSSQSSNFVYI